MNRIRVRKLIDSETMTLPELKPFIGHTVEIFIVDQSIPEGPVDFWAYASRLPTTEADFNAQQEQFRLWRSDLCYESHWPIIDKLLCRDFARTRAWAEVNQTVQTLQDYDYAAVLQQNDIDIRDLQGREL